MTFRRSRTPRMARRWVKLMVAQNLGVTVLPGQRDRRPVRDVGHDHVAPAGGRQHHRPARDPAAPVQRAPQRGWGPAPRMFVQHARRRPRRVTADLHGVQTACRRCRRIMRRGRASVYGGGVSSGQQRAAGPEQALAQRGLGRVVPVAEQSARLQHGHDSVHLEGVQVDLLGGQRLPACSLVRLIRQQAPPLAVGPRRPRSQSDRRRRPRSNSNSRGPDRIFRLKQST